VAATVTNCFRSVGSPSSKLGIKPPRMAASAAVTATALLLAIFLASPIDDDHLAPARPC